MRVGVAADHGGFTWKRQVTESLRGMGYEAVDFGAHELNAGDDYPDFIIPLARSVAAREVERGVAVCGSGVGASVAANKVPGVLAGLIHDVFSAHQGVEDDDMNVSGSEPQLKHDRSTNTLIRRCRKLKESASRQGGELP